MNKLLSMALSAALLAGCRQETPPAQTVVCEADGSTMAVMLPQGLSAAELIQLRGVCHAALTIRAAQRYAEAQLAAVAVIGCFAIHCLTRRRP